MLTQHRALYCMYSAQLSKCLRLDIANAVLKRMCGRFLHVIDRPSFKYTHQYMLAA